MLLRNKRPMFSLTQCRFADRILVEPDNIKGFQALIWETRHAREKRPRDRDATLVPQAMSKAREDQRSDNFIASGGKRLMSDTIHTLSTAGLTPGRQIQIWSDVLADLCGRFDIDPLCASSLEGRMALTAVSRLKLCQIELSQHRIAPSAARATTGDHPYIKIHFQTAGISHFDQDGKRIALVPGDCLSYDVARPHAMISPASTRHDVVIVPKTLLEDRGIALQHIPTCKLSARTGTGRIAHDLVRATFNEAAEISLQSERHIADSMIDVLLLPLLQASSRGLQGRPAATYLRAQRFIREHLHDPDLRLDRICAELGCSKRYLHMLFSDRGATVSDYIWKNRLHSCRQEIEADASKKITDIAFSWGFSSSSHFSRMFRKYFGIAPSSIHKARVPSASSI